MSLISKSSKYDGIVSRIQAGDLLTASRELADMPLDEASRREKILNLLLRRKLSRLHYLDGKPVPASMPGGRPWPKISIVTPTYNQGRFIEETIVSVLSQGYPALEYVVVDGASTDDTGVILEHYRPLIDVIVSEKDRGQSDAINKGMRLATGEILTWLNSDDCLTEGALFAMALAFETSGADMVAGVVDLVKDGRVVGRHLTSCEDGELPIDDLLDLDGGWNAGKFFYQPEVFFRRSLWEAAGAHVREDCYYSMDYEMWCRFAHARARLHVIGRSVVRFRMHDDQKTAQPEKFKKELVAVRDRFAAERNLQPRSTTSVESGRRKLRIAFVNDNGFKYGAGIAHQRIAASFDMAGHDLAFFELPRIGGPSRPGGGLQGLIDELSGYDPDFVLLGNVHSSVNGRAADVGAIADRFRLVVISHDFWWLTGRCAYFGDCRKYLEGCDGSCPTASEYPALEPRRIQREWRAKRKILSGPQSALVLGNSSWARSKFEEVIAGMVDGACRVDEIRLGVPEQAFSGRSREDSRRWFEIGESDFVIAFSSSSLADVRKGGDLLLDALRSIPVEERRSITLIAIGRGELPIELEGVRVVSTGYVNQPEVIATAYAAADLFVGPSREETFGQVFAEAAMVGIPSLGLEGSGVSDAIREGVTGALVSQGVEALSEKIVWFMRNRSHLGDVSFFSRIHARNEFSLEASYRTFHVALRRNGFFLPGQGAAKISFPRQSALVTVDGSAGAWHVESGASDIEGPYPPEVPAAFQWITSRRATLSATIPEGTRQLRLKLVNLFFDRVEIGMTIAGRDAPRREVQRSGWEDPQFAEFPCEGISGRVRLGVEVSDILPASESEPRELSLALLGVEFVR